MGNQFHSRSTDQLISGLTLSVEKLSKRFNREWIFRDLSFDFTAGNTYAITGPNGSGKSTLLQVLWGQVPQTSGTIGYQKGSRNIPVQDISAHISIATPYMDLIDEFTLEEQLNFHFKLKPIRSGITISDLLEILYLEHAGNKTIGNFSSGMKQRLKLGLAFYTQADILFLDEPGTNLDGRAFEWYLMEFKKMPPGCLVFIASNDPAEYPENAFILNMEHFKK